MLILEKSEVEIKNVLNLMQHGTLLSFCNKFVIVSCEKRN